MENINMHEIIDETDLKCPITGEFMLDPVSVENGSTYERQAITEWLMKSDLDPLTNAKLSNKNLSSNKIIRRLIDEYFKSSRDKTIQRYTLEKPKKKKAPKSNNLDPAVFRPNYHAKHITHFTDLSLYTKSQARDMIKHLSWQQIQKIILTDYGHRLYEFLKSHLVKPIDSLTDTTMLHFVFIFADEEYIVWILKVMYSDDFDLFKLNNGPEILVDRGFAWAIEKYYKREIEIIRGTKKKQITGHYIYPDVKKCDLILYACQNGKLNVAEAIIKSTGIKLADHITELPCYVLFGSISQILNFINRKAEADTLFDEFNKSGRGGISCLRTLWSNRRIESYFVRTLFDKIYEIYRLTPQFKQLSWIHKKYTDFTAATL